MPEKNSDLLEKIIEAKKIIGDKAIPKIVEHYHVDTYDPVGKKACCPFHREDTPSFIWNEDEQFFKCFGCGRVVSLLDVYTDECGSYVKGVEKLCKEAGVEFNTKSVPFDRGDFFKTYRFPKPLKTTNRDIVDKYCEKRGISKKTLDHAGVKQDPKGNVVFEFFDMDGTLLCRKYRLSHPAPKGQPKMWWDGNADNCPALFNLNKIDITKPVVVTEGPMDSLAVIQSGYTNVVSIPGGAEDSKWIEFNYEVVEKIPEFILWYDNDKAGQDGLKKAISRLGEYRCKIVTPEKEDEDAVEKWYKGYNENLSIRKTDANNVLLACGYKRVSSLINSAKEVPVENMIDLMTEEEFDIEKTKHISSGISELDNQIYGFIDGSLNIWTAYAGSGKAQPLSSNLLGKNGYFKMRDVKVGDEIYGDDGKLHSVTGVYPQGVKDIYRVVFSDKSSTLCSEDHLWTIKVSSRRSNPSGGICTETLRDIMSKEKLCYNAKSGKKWNIFIPMCKPVEFEEKELPVDPYLLGLLIGDGGFTQETINFSNTEGDILETLESKLPDYVHLTSKGNNKDYRIAKTIGGKVNPFTEKIRKLGLMGKPSGEKFIPDIYKYSSIEQRIELMRGLIDTDGEVIPNGYVYSSKSLQLIQDIAFVINSLGGTAHCSERLSRYTKSDGTRSNAFKSYRAHIKMPKDILLFSSEKHKREYVEPQFGSYRSIRSIEYVGKEECQCIMVDNPSHLYLTDNCIVTHNTTMIAQTCVLEAIDKGESVFWFNAESTTSQMLNWILSQAAGRDHMIEFKNENGFSYYKPTRQAVEKIKQFYKDKIYVYDNLLLSSANDVLDKMKYMYRRRGTKVFVLDNWLCLNFRGKSDAEITGIQVDFMNELIHFAKKNNLEIHLVAHPRKPQANMPLTEYDILGSSNIVNMADRIYGLEKVWDDTLKNGGYDRQFTVFKDRILGVKGERIGLRYDRVTRRLYSDSDDKYRKYKWDNGSLKYDKNEFGENGLLVGRRTLDYEQQQQEQQSERTPY